MGFFSAAHLRTRSPLSPGLCPHCRRRTGCTRLFPELFLSLVVRLGERLPAGLGVGPLACPPLILPPQAHLQSSWASEPTPPHCCPSSSTDPDDQYKLTEDTRQLGLVVCRGTSVVLICPQDGMEAIPNPFIQQQDA